jgi:hypothetical protein
MCIRVLETYLSGEMIDGLKRRADEAVAQQAPDLRSVETSVMKFLQARLAAAKTAAAA